MKPYLLAPIVIAGLITAAGTSSIASTEMNLFKSGRDAVAMLRFEKGTPAPVANMDWTSDSVRGALASDLDIDLDPDTDGAVIGQPAPEMTIDSEPIACEKAQKDCEKAEAACERAKAAEVKSKTTRKVRLATLAPKALPNAPEAPKGLLTSSYAFRTLPSPEGPKSFSMVMGTDKDGQVVRLAGLPGKEGQFHMVFDTKKFTAYEKDFSKGMNKIEWKSLSADELKQLKKFGVDVKVKGWAKDQVPTSITINPLQAAAAAQVQFEAMNDKCDSKDADKDEEDDITSK